MSKFITMIIIQETNRKPTEVGVVDGPLQRKAASFLKAADQINAGVIAEMFDDTSFMSGSLQHFADTEPPPSLSISPAPDVRAIEASMLSQAKVDFGSRYQMYWVDPAGGIADPMPISDTIEVLFKEIKGKVELFIGTVGVPENTVAIRFFHRLNELANKWFLTMDICTMSWDEGQSAYVLTDYDGWRFDIAGRDTIQVSGFAGDYDESYFKYVGYLNSLTGVYEKLNPEMHIKSIVFPWVQEIKELCSHNGLDNDPEAVIVFCSCSFVVQPENINVIAKVQWPHGIVMHMKKGQFNYLGFNNSVLGPFHNRGADVGGLCPPNCSTYRVPDNTNIYNL